MWCRPEPSSVSPIYMPGRLRTASRPLRTLMLSASYVFMLGSDIQVTSKSLGKKNAVADFEYFATRAVEQRKIGTGHPGLGGQGMDFLEQGGPAGGIQMRGDLVQQQDGRQPLTGERQPARISQHDG